MSKQAVEVEPTEGCRICGKTDGTSALTAYILCLEHRQLAVQAPTLQAQNRALLAALEAVMPLAQAGFSALPRSEQDAERQAVLRQARAAIAQEKEQG